MGRTFRIVLSILNNCHLILIVGVVGIDCSVNVTSNVNDGIQVHFNIQSWKSSSNEGKETSLNRMKPYASGQFV